ncbi:MAG: DUF1329 domain-containing protein [bacterium]
MTHASAASAGRTARRKAGAVAAVAAAVVSPGAAGVTAATRQSGPSPRRSSAARGPDITQMTIPDTRRTLRAARGAAKRATPCSALQPTARRGGALCDTPRPADELPNRGGDLVAAPARSIAAVRSSGRCGTSALAGLLLIGWLLGTVGAARGDVQPGDVISAKQLDAAREFLTPGLEWVVRRGMSLPVVATGAIAAPVAYREATERYAAHVRLGADGVTLQNYVAGLPFPIIDPADPQAAVKVMWNSEYKWLATDDLDARDFDADAGSIGHDGAGMVVDRHFVLGYLRRLFYNGRLYVDPKPARPNPDAIRYRESLHPLEEPADLRGVGMTSVRYMSATQPDESWLYLPNLRRVRRLSSAQRSDALFNQDIDSDSYFGYSGHIGWMDWKFLGERTVLAPMHGKHFPVVWGGGSADFAFDDVWEKRRVYVIEGTSKLPQYAYGKRVLYVDQETWVVPLSDIYDHNGQLSKVWLNLFHYQTEPFAGAKTSVYPSPMGFSPAVVMVDVNTDHVTRVALPSRKSGSEGWFFNMGDRLGLSEDWFKISHLIQTAQ